MTTSDTTTPTGTPRPPGEPRARLSTLEELHLAKVDLADSTVLERPQRDINALLIYNLRDLRSQTSERDVALFTKLASIESQGQKAVEQGRSAAAKSGASAFWARFGGLVLASLTALVAFGDALNRTDQKGLGAVLLALSAVLARFGPALAKAADPAQPPPDRASSTPPPEPPPAHS